MLDTDHINAEEIAAALKAPTGPEALASQDTAPRLAVWFYRDRMAEGYNRDMARCMAILYLRRKTGLSWPIAAGMFDSSAIPATLP